MVKKSNKSDQTPVKPKIIKRRTPVPEPEEVEGGTSPEEEVGEDEYADPDEVDEITRGEESIFTSGKPRGGLKNKDSFNEMTDGVMFNPSEPPMGFDSEWVRFLNQLSADETTKSLADYIKIAPLTRRAKYKLMIYIKTLLDREFTMSNILDKSDMSSVQLDKLLIDADLTLGLTRFDLSPEFQHIINLVRIKFGIKVRRSLFGFERINVNTQRSVQESNEGGGDQRVEVKRNIRDRIKDLFKGD
jgi:hypothetical protein